MKPAFFEEGLGLAAVKCALGVCVSMVERHVCFNTSLLILRGTWARRRDIKARDKVLAVPKKLWISVEAVEKSKLGPIVAGQPPWVQIALFLISEKCVSSQATLFLDHMPLTGFA